MTRLFRVIDVETTGLPTDEGGAAVCEIAYCDVIVNGEQAYVPGLPTAIFVNPGRPIPATARAIHHISDDDVHDGASISDACCALCAGIDDSTVFAAHNADFENHFVVEPVRICTYKVALRLWPDAPAHGNQVLRYHLGLDLVAEHASPPHRAGPDTYVTAHLLARCINEGRASIDDMLRWSSGPALLPRIPFGKHRGSRWEDVPIDYLDWVANKSDLDRDAKANARHHLKLRSA